MIKKIKAGMKRILKSKANVVAVMITLGVVLVSLLATYIVPYAVEQAIGDNTSKGVVQTRYEKEWNAKEKEHIGDLKEKKKDDLDVNLNKDDSKELNKDDNEKNSDDIDEKSDLENEDENYQNDTELEDDFKSNIENYLCKYTTCSYTTTTITQLDEESALANGYTPIRTVNELVEATTNSTGKYILLSDLDMSGVEWTPWDFDGEFEGNGYTIYNLNITTTGKSTYLIYDGNYKKYDTYAAGFFGILKGSVSNLNLVAVNVNIATNNYIMAGTIAGITENATISNCTIYGKVELTTSAMTNGVGGVVGYGNGSVKNCKIDITLVSVDTDVENKDENFLGGVLGAGYLDIDDCNVIIDGYDSNHGYVHSGGLVGMYILYPYGTDYEGSITGNTITGTINFFEDNVDRRAYCKGLIGEVMNWTFAAGSNDYTDFVRNEVFDYYTNLYPEGDRDNVTKTEELIVPTTITPGYTIISYATGYSYNTDYVLPVTNVEDWEVVKEATPEEQGIRKGTDTVTGKVVYEDYEYEDTITIEEVNADNTTIDNVTSSSIFKTVTLPIIAGVVVVILLILRFNVFRRKKSN